MSSRNLKFWVLLKRGFSQKFSRNRYGIKLNSQWDGYKHMVDFTSRFLDPQWVYGQTLLVSDQLGKVPVIFLLRWICNDPRPF